MDGSSPRMRGIPIASNNGTICLSVHPRGCGEYVKYSGSFASRIGSSPRMRGIRPPAQQASRGDGSSPRMRGIRAAFVVARAASRFIPADAGNTVSTATTPRCSTVHPRGCGEYQWWPLACSMPYGSSPRMRGIPVENSRDLPVHRFIPADAGNTAMRQAQAKRLPVHPRGCGEYDKRSPELKKIHGSSPRMRGILEMHEKIRAGRRFIPADAGNTAPDRYPGPGLSVHPRGCGEYWLWRNNLLLYVGSSPRMRGIRGCFSGTPEQFRFIPADAGNTAPCPTVPAQQPVHPRGCGEYFATSPPPTHTAGSSPRMRGIRHAAHLGTCAFRFIPADAGNTT